MIKITVSVIVGGLVGASDAIIVIIDIRVDTGFIGTWRVFNMGKFDVANTGVGILDCPFNIIVSVPLALCLFVGPAAALPACMLVVACLL